MDGSRRPRRTRRNRKTEYKSQDGSTKSRHLKLTIHDVLPESTKIVKQKEKKQEEKLQIEARIREDKNREELSRQEGDYDYLYPSLDDPLFNKKIAERQEFYDTRYIAESGDIHTIGTRLCNAEFELAPHQMFVRNFMSYQTPYNSLLLYHGLGSGKTCSAISVAEEMRDYMKQMGISQRIIVVASPNVQNNFRLQLFDERKLEEIDGLWNIRACTGNKFLKEINPMNMKGFTKERVVTQVKRIINTAYVFMGYIEFANYVNKKTSTGSDISDSKREQLLKIKCQKHFGNRLIIIDEVHNIRITDDNKDKRVAIELDKLVDNVDNLRLLLLSATPMYNSYKESIWLLNLMNKNDKRFTIDVKDVFEKDGSFKVNEEGKDVGRELFMRKATGYVSFMRGDNPYTFPFRIWPNDFAPEYTFSMNEIPNRQLNGKPILHNLDIISLYLTEIGNIQQQGYNMIIDKLKSGEFSHEGHNGSSFETMESFGYTLLQRPLEALNIVYPISSDDIEIKDIVGKGGLERVMSYKESLSSARFDFEYRPGMPKIFTPREIGMYSGKIKNICNTIINSNGVALIYSQYIDGGVLPIALALEELGFTRVGSGKSLLKNRPAKGSYNESPPPTGWYYDASLWHELNQELLQLAAENVIDSNTSLETALEQMKDSETLMRIKSDISAETYNLLRIALNNATKPMHYAMITGDKAISPDNIVDLKAVTDADNINGDKVRVIIISQAGSEGLDFKFIRQVHVLEPWYNMNRIEQIIGRAVRICSHKDLPFVERNVQLYLHGSLLPERDEEAADVYVYRLAEVKAQQIGNVSRALKEVAIDCILNFEQQGFTIEHMKQNIEQVLSNGKIIAYQVGDKPYSAICDYMDKCTYSCKPTSSIKESDVKLDSYNESFIIMNTDKIMQRVRDLMKERYFYRKVDLVKELIAIKNYPLVQIDAALTQLIEDKNEYISDGYGRVGHLINIGDLYLFQPLELNNNHISLHDRQIPLEWKRDKLVPNLMNKVDESMDDKLQSEHSHVPTTVLVKSEIINKMKSNYNIAITPQTLKRGEDNWYKFCSVAIDQLVEDGIRRDILEQLLLEHLVDDLSYRESLSLLNEFEIQKPDSNSFEEKIFVHMTKDIIRAKGTTGIIMDNMGKTQIVVRRDNKWSVAQPEDLIDLNPPKEEYIKKFVPLKTRLNSRVGFMSNFKNEYFIFKTRDFTIKRTLGARCDQATKSAGVKLLNAILGEEKYKTSTPISKKQICIMQELILRFYNMNFKDEKIWFLTPIQALISNVEKSKF